MQYSNLILRCMGIASPPYRPDETAMVLKCIEFFRISQGIWLDILEEDCQKSPSKDLLKNLQTGGICSIFVIIDQI